MQERSAKVTPSTTQLQNNTLPPLAPCDAQMDATAKRSGPPDSGRAPRLSHRSRAGCWTCRGRKVKCDEKRPVCGQCARLSRVCDWEHRWSFNDATIITQEKHTNVTTAGNAVWDASARTSSGSNSQTRQYDDLPPFGVLRSDEERERKAETRSPGTFGVVVTPESFADLPEYASAASPANSRQIIGQFSNDLSDFRSSSSTAESLAGEDPTTVVLQHFEDISPASITSQSTPVSPRRSSFPDYMQELTISESLPSVRAVAMMPSLSRVPSDDERYLKHFRRYIVPRLVQPAIFEADAGQLSLGSSTKDIFEIEAARFGPLHHAICAVSALNLAYTGRTSLEVAMQHYHQALSSSVDPTNADEMLSDGVFLRHFLLFVYDICVPMSTNNGGAHMWAEHLGHLLRLTIKRRERWGHEPLGYIVWTICELDMYACARGSGTCDFITTITQRQMLPELYEQIPHRGLGMGSPYRAEEEPIFPYVLAMNQSIVVETAKLARLADLFRIEQTALGSVSISPETYRHWQREVARAQSELISSWSRNYPSPLRPESIEAGNNLPPRVRFVFEHGFALYYAAIIYSQTSMFLGQRLMPVAIDHSVVTDIEHCCTGILSLATIMLDGREQPDFYSRRRIVFPIFLAGFATASPSIRRQALDLLRRLEGSGGIGQNTFYTRQLLGAVAEAQHHAQLQGVAVETVEWFTIAQERGLNVVNCGL